MIQNNDQDTWEGISKAINESAVPFQHKAILNHNGKPVTIDMDMDPGGGFEGGYEFTVLSAPVPIQFTSLSVQVSSDNHFRFAIHDQKVLDRIGKFFGMEDVNLGYEEFDKRIVIKTNDKDRARNLFADPSTRKVLQSLHDFSLQFEEHDDGTHTLDLMIDRLVNDTGELRKIYDAFVSILDKLETL